MEFRKRNNLRHPYCLYLTESEAEKLVREEDVDKLLWSMRRYLMNQFEREHIEKRLAEEFRDGVPPL